jgi:hypothetical protein
VHDIDIRDDFTMLLRQPKRKPIAAKLEHERQDTLYRHWEHLRSLANQRLARISPEGGDAATIPERFVAMTSGYDPYLKQFQL